MWGNFVLILLLIVASGATVFSQAKDITELRQMFDYEWRRPLDVKEVGVEDKAGVRVHDISFASPKGGRVTAYLVVPAGKGPFAGIIFMHARPGSRNSFLNEALSFARSGAVSLLIDAPFSRSGESKRDFDPTVTKPEADRDIYIQTVVDLRRGVDLLVARSDVDAKRIGFVGFSYGAHTGAVLAGVEKRIKAFVIMSGAPSLTEFLRTSTIPAIVETRNSLTKEQQTNYFTTLSAVDPINYIGYAAPAALFLQFGKKDHYPSAETQAPYASAASNPKVVKTYDSGHELNDEARRDRAEWLQQQIVRRPNARILESLPPPNEPEISRVRASEDWRNPFVVVNRDGYELILRNQPRDQTSLTLRQLEEKLLKLPRDGWPFGKVIAVVENALRSPGDDVKITSNLKKVIQMLKSYKLSVREWPSN